jgi:hypothetical protein
VARPVAKPDYDSSRILLTSSGIISYKGGTPLTEGAAVITGTGWRGEAAPCGAGHRWSATREAQGNSGVQVEGPGLPSEIRPPVLRRAAPAGAMVRSSGEPIAPASRRCESPHRAKVRPDDPGAAEKCGNLGLVERRATTPGTGSKKNLSELVPGVPLPCSLTVRRLCPEPPGGFGGPCALISRRGDVSYRS